MNTVLGSSVGWYIQIYIPQDIHPSSLGTMQTPNFWYGSLVPRLTPLQIYIPPDIHPSRYTMLPCFYSCYCCYPSDPSLLFSVNLLPIPVPNLIPIQACSKISFPSLFQNLLPRPVPLGEGLVTVWMLNCATITRCSY